MSEDFSVMGPGAVEAETGLWPNWEVDCGRSGTARLPPVAVFFDKCGPRNGADGSKQSQGKNLKGCRVLGFTAESKISRGHRSPAPYLRTIYSEERNAILRGITRNID